MAYANLQFVKMGQASMPDNASVSSLLYTVPQGVQAVLRGVDAVCTNNLDTFSYLTIWIFPAGTTFSFADTFHRLIPRKEISTGDGWQHFDFWQVLNPGDVLWASAGKDAISTGVGNAITVTASGYELT